MPRGMRWLGWVFIAGACVLVFCSGGKIDSSDTRHHLLMGFFFGVLHLAYGAYLYLTEKRKNAA